MDDIVARLWELANYVETEGNTWGADDCREAVDEIKRLRKEVSRLMTIICDASPDDDYFLVRQEHDAIWEKVHTSNFAKYEHTPIDPVKSKQWKDMGR